MTKPCRPSCPECSKYFECSMKRRVFTFLISYVVSFSDFQNFSFLQRREVYYYPHMPIGKVWIYRLLLVCVFVCVCAWVCVFVQLRISLPRIKLTASNFARRFIGVQDRIIISHFGELCSPEAQNWTNPRGPRAGQFVR